MILRDYRCPLCGGLPGAPVRMRWELNIPVEPPSQNTIATKGPTVFGRAARFQYKKIREAYVAALRILMMAHPRTPPATGHRRVRFTRLYSGRGRRRDKANMIGGMKTLVDAMVIVGLIRDDTEQGLGDTFF